jgi:hypothetical protein
MFSCKVKLLVVSLKGLVASRKVTLTLDSHSDNLIVNCQLSRALQGRLRRDIAIVELTVDKSSVTGHFWCWYRCPEIGN